MFMSTRYKKRPEPLVRKRPIFSVDDSLAKLCEFLNNESSVTKLITPKYKDFRSQKLKFDQKTRLNNAIWRAWHIQYKMKKKARFLQFAAPFSDETQHSISQAVLLEGKYWKRRLENVSDEFKKWRRLHKEKLIKNSGDAIKDISVTQDDEDDTFSESDLDESDNVSISKSNHRPAEKNLDTLSAMYAFPDTLFSSLDLQKDVDHNQQHQIFKDSSGMFQPSLNHLNPSFDELLDNFDFLLSNDFGSYNAPPTQPNEANQEMLMHHGYSTAIQSSSYIQENSVQNQDDTYANISNMMFQQQPPHQPGGKHMSNITAQSVEDQQREGNYRNNPDDFQQLPPQLQAPNLTAHIQAAMSTRPKARNKSDSNLTQSAKLHSKKRECSSSTPTLNKRLRRQQSQAQSADKNKKIAQKKILDPYQPILPQALHNSSSLPANLSSTKYPTKSSNIPILPKSTSNQTLHNQTRQAQMLFSDNNTYFPVTTTPATYVIVSSCVPVITQTSHPVGKNTTPHQSHSHLSTYSPSHHHSMTSTHSSARNSLPVHHPSDTGTPPVSLFVHSPQHQQQQQQQQQQHFPGLPNVFTAQNSGINESQLVQLAQLLQNAPQGNEATLSYLEMLQQQLQLMLKHQQENIQFKQQLEQQAGRMLGSHSSSLQSSPQSQQPPQTVTHQMAVQSPVIVSSTFSQQHEQYHNMADYSSSNQGDKSPPPEQHFSRQSSLEIPLPRNINKSNQLPAAPVEVTQAGYAFTVHQHPTTKTPTVDLTNSLKESKVISYRQELAKNRPPDSPSSPSSASTTLDSAIALVALRHGSVTTTDSISKELSTHSENVSFSVGQLERVTSHVGDSPTNYNRIPSNTELPPQQQPRTEHRRQCHLSAEQRRRGMIKNGFEDLGNILHQNNFIQGPDNGRPPKLSNAAILQHTAAFIKTLLQEQTECDATVTRIEQEIEQMRSDISKCQKRLPSSVSEQIPQISADVEKDFVAYCKDLIQVDAKAWIFSAIVRPLFDSYNKNVRTRTVDDFVASVFDWVESHFTLPNLRLVILDTLTKLSTSTKILDDADCLSELASSALSIEDPTSVSSTAAHMKQQQQAKKSHAATAPLQSSATPRPQLWNKFSSGGGGSSFYPKTRR